MSIAFAPLSSLVLPCIYIVTAPIILGAVDWLIAVDIALVKINVLWAVIENMHVNQKGATGTKCSHRYQK